MSTLPTTPSFDLIYQIEETDPVIGGGPDSIDNLPHTQLGNRDEWLRARILEAVRTGGIFPVTGTHNITIADIGEVLTIHDPATAIINLPALAGFPKNCPITILVTKTGSDNVSLNCAGADTMSDYLNDSGGVGIYGLIPGTRLVFIATDTSWLVIFKTAPIATVSGFLPGDIATSASLSLVRAGFFLCDGSLKNRATYAELFAAIGTTYGAGDGVNTFAVPDHRDLFLRTWNGGGSGYDIGRTFGVLQEDELKNHSHTWSMDGSNDSLSGTGYVATSNGSSGGGTETNNTYISSIGGVETRPKNISVNTFIKY
jgi:microcystin-dependent protein